MHVLRLVHGSPLTLFNGQGLRAKATLLLENGEVEVDIQTPEVHDDARPSVTIAAAIPKGERADWLIEKCTELGADAVVWVRCARSVVEPKNIDNKVGRWERVAESAARQSGRDLTPVIRAPIALPDYLAQGTQDIKLIAHPYDAQTLSQVLQGTQRCAGLRVLIGPEGGLTEDELHLAKAAGYTAWSLNRHILRTETAAVAAAALLAEVAQNMERG